MASRACCRILFSLLLVSLFANVFPSAQDGCPKIQVKKNQILRTKEALNNGAKYLKRAVISTARECYNLCCRHSSCNLAMISYTNSTSGSDAVRMCYLFDCGSPSKCMYAPYSHYATIEFDDREDYLESDLFGKMRNEQKAKPKTSHHRDEDCPPGAPTAMCSSNPCDVASCPGHPYASCKPSFCGTCHAQFYDDDGIPVNCHVSGFNSKAKKKKIPSLQTDWITDYLKDQNNPMKSQPKDSDKDQAKEGTGWDDKTQIDEIGTKQPQQTEEPFHQWREFLDNNPKYGKVKKVTEKPKPVPKPTQKPKHTAKPKTHPIVHPKTHPMPTTLAKAPLTYPSKANPEVPKPDEDVVKPNISDVVVIETSHLRIVENKAVLPLAIFLVVAIVMLLVVALRLRIVKSRLRRKTFATDDADYLINGMYL
ncbi:uncharacterized protein LOC5515582 [Nematostella vectensis]|uniref:uncharacterized protein LOC5515582 n=1 Tax=Nematostella vectensis TaxID=45351 RepID=UPI00138FDAF0|nr:uncharacterized protein LOC5515582 [Nematostella vectensis]